MPRFPGLRRFMRLDRGGAAVERALDDELRFHFDMTIRELIEKGMAPDDARREALRRFGDVERTRDGLARIDKSRVDRERRIEWWSGFAQDVRYALRGLRLKPGFATAVILTLGLGIGANAAMFGIVDRLLFRAPAFLRAPERVSRLYLVRMVQGTERYDSFTGYHRYRDLREWTRSFDAITPFYWNYIAIGSGEAAREMNVGVSAAAMWKMFDVQPVIGRFFTEQEDVTPEGARVVVISHALWQTQFAGRIDVLGAPIRVGPDTYTIIGVAPAGFNAFVSDPLAAFIPITAHAAGEFRGRKIPWYETYGMTWFEVFARRRPGVTLEQADADLSAAYQRSFRTALEANPRGTPYAVARPRAFAGPIQRDRGPNEGKDAKVATWLIGVTAIVLIIACVNVVNLLLARAFKRRRELAVRIALGVSRARLIVQLTIESVMLAILGGVAGVLIAQWGGAVIHTQLLNLDKAPSALTDGRVLFFAAVLAAFAGLATGLVPAVQAWHTDIAASLKAGAREGTVQRSRLRTGLLVGQAALSVVLLVGAGLFVRSLSNVRDVRLGYDADQLLYVTINYRGMTFDSVQRVVLREQLVERAKASPDVEHAARALTVPFWSTWQIDLFVTGIDSVNKLGAFTMQSATPEFFQTMGTRIVRGRGLAATDRANAPLVMVVSDAMAKRIWPREDAIGKCIRVNEDSLPCTTVVGIAEDVRRGNLTEPDLHYYLSIDQFKGGGGNLFIRMRGRASVQAERVRTALQHGMPGMSYVSVVPMSTIIGQQTRSWRLGATMFGAFGALALLLAAIGLYSVIAYNVTQRMHEMGVRVALGAQVSDVVSLVLREGLTVVIPGIAIGTTVALFAGRWVAPLLFQVSPRDPAVLIAVVISLLTVAATASWIPALRAARVDPNQALRAD